MEFVLGVAIQAPLWVAAMKIAPRILNAERFISQEHGRDFVDLSV